MFRSSGLATPITVQHMCPVDCSTSAEWEASRKGFQHIELRLASMEICK